MKNSFEKTSPVLKVLSWGGAWGRALQEEVSEPFTRQTGIAVSPQHHVGLNLPEDLSGLDLIWSNAVPALKVAGEGGCVSLNPEEIPHLTSLHPRAMPWAVAGDWPLVCPYAVHYVLGYRRSAFPGGKPDSWSVLLEPRFQGKVALYPEGNGLHPIAQVMGGGRLEDIPEGMEACWKFIAELRPQVGRLDYSIGMEERIRRGELDIFFRALPNALAFREAGLDVDWAAPREGIADTLDAFWIPKNRPEESVGWAKRYIDFALSPPILERWCAKLGALPLSRKAAPSALFREHHGLPGSADDFSGVLHIPEAVKSKNLAKWKERFEWIFHN
ncbi:MAG TPA: extracellular solute-binding protein [bacterium]|nr:extracellular solute-binding protein [bacterium]